MHQVDVASTLYAIYNLIALFFPAPLLMFRLPFWYHVKRCFFGIHKPTFILLVVAVWWGIEYFHPIWYNPEIRLYLKMLRVGDPCLYDRNFIKAKKAVIQNVCEELVTMESEFTATTLAINRMSSEVGFFVNSCNCSFPNQNLLYFQTPQYIQYSEAKELGFMREMQGLCESPYCNRLFLPSKDISFLGETSMCYDTSLARKYLFQSPGDVKLNWWQIWISTGILAQLVVTFAVTNFCIASYRMGDPLSMCGGRFEWPPEYLFRGGTDGDTSGIPPDKGMELRERKTKCLGIMAFKRVIFWGVLTQLCLLNLALAPVGDESVNMLGSTDGLVFFLCLAAAVIVLSTLPCLRYYLQLREEEDKLTREDNPNSYVMLGSDQNASNSSRVDPVAPACSSTDSSSSSSSKEEGSVRSLI